MVGCKSREGVEKGERGGGAALAEIADTEFYIVLICNVSICQVGELKVWRGREGMCK